MLDSIFRRQTTLQKALSREPVYTEDLTVGEVYGYILQMKFFIEEEITEIMEALGDGSRDIHKPWKDSCRRLRDKKYRSTSKLREEAVDMLCFSVNLCIGLGITEDTIGAEYNKVYLKNVRRLRDDIKNEFFKGVVD